MARYARSVALTLALLTIASGCTTFVPVSPRAGASEPELEIQFATPVRLVATRGGERVVRRNVTRVGGRALDVRGDTVVLQVSRWQSTGFWAREWPPLVATVVASDACTDVGTRRYSPGRTAAAILAPPVIAYVLFFIVCSSAPVPCFY